MTDEEKNQIKELNHDLMKSRDYRFNAWLPILENPKIRTLRAIKRRLSIMNAMVNISFEAPVSIIKDWIENHGLTPYLSNWEKEILLKVDDEITNFDRSSLAWYNEGIWALMWATKQIDNLDEREWCGDNMASLLPNLEQNDDNSKIDLLAEMQYDLAIYKMLDFYYRLHWYCVDERFNGREAKLNEGLVYERRKALEWAINNESDWDDIEMGT